MRWNLLATAVGLAVGIGAGVVWGRHLLTQQDPRNAVDSDRRVTTADGRLSMDLPRGWTETTCSTAQVAPCLRIAPAGAGEQDVIMLTVHRNEERRNLYALYTGGLPVDAPDQPSLRHLTIDGMDAIRFDMDQLPGGGTVPEPRGIMIVGRMSDDGSEAFTLSCRSNLRATEIRAACDPVAGSLRLRR